MKRTTDLEEFKKAVVKCAARIRNIDADFATIEKFTDLVPIMRFIWQEARMTAPRKEAEFIQIDGSTSFDGTENYVLKNSYRNIVRMGDPEIYFIITTQLKGTHYGVMKDEEENVMNRLNVFRK